MTDQSAEQLALRRLQHRLHLVGELIRQRDGKHWDLASDDSDIARDDAVLAPFQLSHLVGHCLSLAFDNLRATHALMIGLREPGVSDDEQQMRLPMAAHYPMLRSAIEAGALAVWLLAPAEPIARRTRLLRARWEDIVQDKLLVLTMSESEPGDLHAERKRDAKMRQEYEKGVRVKKRRMREVADLAGVAYEEMYRGLPGFEQIVGEGVADAGLRRRYAAGHWRLVSGLSHPSASRSLIASNMEELGDDGQGSIRAGKWWAKTAKAGTPRPGPQPERARSRRAGQSTASADMRVG